MKILVRSFLLLVGLALFSCSENNGKPIIPKEDMGAIMADYYLMQSTLSQFDVSHGEKRFYYYEWILEKYNYTEADFDSSIVWYTKYPGEFDKAYDLALERITKMKDSLAIVVHEQANSAQSSSKEKDSIVASIALREKERQSLEQAAFQDSIDSIKKVTTFKK